MLPILLDLKIFKIYTFGVFLVLAFFWGSFLIWKLIRLTSMKEEEVFDGLFWGLFGGLFLSRLFYVDRKSVV
jgi:prolipoprotein diacylglyceryltransferase